ncbi:MAG TPA: AbrB/MazE/SpoVT family DNA-binding domain-containing protein [Desulfuromonadales bacterium]|nr:AbrB/MazE/SpoVT family DNA-binding domain-containing protein [Desulfuromonadales bacterium]
MLARKTSKNQLTLPKEVVGNFPGIDLFDASVDNNRIILTPVKIVPIDPSLEKIRKKMERLGIVENDVTEAIQWARN